MGGWRGPEALLLIFFKDKGVGMHYTKLWAIQVFKLAKMKGNLQWTLLFNTTEVYSHSKISQDWPSLHFNTRQLIQIATVVQKSSQQKQTT